MTVIASFDIGEKNFAYSVGTKDYLNEWYHVDVVKRKGQTISESCDAITSVLKEKELTTWIWCKKVIIEQQMRCNIRAQRLAQHVWTWFRLTLPEINVEFVPSSLKTRHFLGPKNDLTPKGRKKWAIEKVREILKERNDIDNLTYMDSLKKKDDIADTYLQLIAYDSK